MVTYAERPWTKSYDSNVPASLDPYPDITVHSFLEEAAQKAPDSVALITSAHLPVLGRQASTMTYAELDRLSGSLAAGLIDMGLKPGDRVAMVMPNIAAFIITYYAILKAGGVVAATNPTYPPDKMAFQINDCDAEIVITMSLFYRMIKDIQPKTKVKKVIVTNVKEYLPPVARLLFTLAKEKKEGHRVETLASGDEWLQDVLTRYANKKANRSVKSSDLALFQYTGGTTGVSKAAMSTHRALVANTLQMRAWLFGKDIPANANNEVFLGAIPMFHAFGMVAVLNFAIGIGARIVLVPNARDIGDVLDNINTFHPTIFMGVPALYNAINNHPDVKAGKVSLRSIRACVSGSAPLPPAVKQEFERLSGGALREGFGMSEAPTASHCNPLLGENRTGSIGLPLPDMDCRIVSLDDGVTDLPVGDVGELIMTGPQLMVGYHGMPTETANVLREQDGKVWLYTGDIARMDDDGYFYIVDRKKDMALIGGFNVYPNAVEKVLTDHPAVLEAGVAAIPHPEKAGQEALKAWIVLRPGMTATEQELIAHCESKLARYEVPTRFAFINELPKTAVGKTLRRELVQMELTERES
ncbi:MAG: long-chain fatty acid--CoA ligase [Chloroflexi bacterium]|nr:long-chain fatty acid--CoA ligase [Chloroflexota bacterium]MDL1884672.1 long-chain fatty acid--CoA ligase [Anaerolineae bacterium CFX8]